VHLLTILIYLYLMFFKTFVIESKNSVLVLHLKDGFGSVVSL